ncbi:MAG: hypothetical protein ABR976_21570 [Terracidiphilus sp.]|jgi:hypothetical protein
MQNNPPIPSDSSPSIGTAQSRNSADIVYQGLTIAAALVLLGSLWLF